MAGEAVLFKLGMSLVFAFIAAMVIALAGLISDVRLMTILVRSLLGFLVTCAGVWVVSFLLEAKNLVGFDKNLDLIGEEEPNPKSPEELDGEDLAAQAADSKEDSEPAQDPSFTLLTKDNLKQVKPPES